TVSGVLLCALLIYYLFFISFFHAEGAIRVRILTGVMSCALPISSSIRRSPRPVEIFIAHILTGRGDRLIELVDDGLHLRCVLAEIGRASCRDRLKKQISLENIKKNMK